MKPKPRKKSEPKALPIRWNTVPLLRILLAFTSGVVFEIFSEVALLPLLVFAVLFSGAFFILHNIKGFSRAYSNRWIFGCLITLSFFFSGASITYLRSEKNYPSHFSNFFHPSNTYVARITEPVVEKTSSLKMVVEILGYSDSLGFHKTQGHLLCYLKKDTSSLKLKYGDVFVFDGKLQPIKEPGNPGEFNYKRFLYFHQLFQQVYLRNTDWKLTTEKKGWWIFEKSYALRDQLVTVLKHYLGTKREYAVASALTVGYDDDIDQELIQAYASSGALHVLSVSGMHVGLIYVVIAWLLIFLDKLRYGKHLKYFLLLLFLWFYAVLTGMTPSVMRSAAMLSFVIIGQWTNRPNLIYNTLAVSAFILLCYNPFYVTEVGFQLSYLAVFGIVFLHPFIFKWYEPDTKIGSHIWTITSVSLAAQAMTFPLGLLYFHQFPLLFIVSNLVVIPLSTVVIFGGLLLLIGSFFDGYLLVKQALLLLSKLVYFFIYLINKVVLFIDQLNFSVINGISISIFETWVIYVAMFLSIAFLVQRRAVHLHLTLCCFIILCATQFIETVKIANQKQLIVYQIKKHSAVNFIDGKNNHFITDAALRNDRSAMLFHVVHHWWDAGVYDSEPYKAVNAGNLKSKSVNLYQHQNFIQFYNKKLLLLDSTFSSKQINTAVPIKLDYLIAGNNSIKALNAIDSKIKIQQVIIDTSNDYKSTRLIKKYCLEKSIPFYDVNEQGAFVYNFDL
jgi:competence protein ComEC